MADPVTPNKGYTIPATGADVNAWGPIVNGNFSNLDSLQGGTYSLAVSSGAYTISSAQALTLRIQITGTVSGAVTITIPQKPGYFYFHDNTTSAQQRAYPITITTGAAGGRTQNLPAALSHVFTDGTNCWLVTEPNKGESRPFHGWIAPPLWQLAVGQTISRTTYADLFAAITFATTGNVTSASNQITGVAAVPVGLVAPFAIPIEGTGIPTGTTLTAYTGSAGNYTLTISQNATATNTGVTLTLLPNGQGDGSTTFNVPDARGRSLIGADAMGGTAASRVTSAVSGVAAGQVGAAGGSQNAQADTLTANSTLSASATTSIVDPGHIHSIVLPIAGHITSGGPYGPGDGNVNYDTTKAFTGITASTTVTGTVATTVTSALTGASQNMPPVLVSSIIIYAGQ